MEFEKRRNIPVKYNRALWDKTGKVEMCFSHVRVVKISVDLLMKSHVSLFLISTVDAMKRVEEIKQKRQAKFIMNR